MPDSQCNCRTTKSIINDTLYIVESFESNNANETAKEKVKRLIMNDKEHCKEIYPN